MSEIATVRNFRWDSVRKVGPTTIAKVAAHGVLANGTGLFDGIRMPDVCRVQINLYNSGGVSATPQLWAKTLPSEVTASGLIARHLIETQDPMVGATRYDLNSASFITAGANQTLIVAEGAHHASVTLERSMIWYQDEITLQMVGVDAGETLVLGMALIITDMRKYWGLR